MDYETIKYQSKNGEVDVVITLEEKIIYMTAQNIATLFGKEKSNILKNIRKILKEEEKLFVANKAYSVAKFATEWKRKGQIIQRKTEHYSINIIIEIGVQLISNEALFLKEYIDNYFKERSNFDNKNFNDIIIYNNGNISIDVRVSPKEDTVWLTQDQIETLFETTRQDIDYHINNIYKTGEIDSVATCKEILQVQLEGDREVTRKIDYFNLDMVLAIGYRVKTKKAIEFRRWATKVLKQYLLKGYSIDQKRTIVTDENFMNLTNEVFEIKEQVRQIKEQQKNLLIEDKIILDGEVFDAHVVMTKIIETARKSILLIDPYVDATTLDKFKAKNKDVSFQIITSNNKSKLSDIEISLFVEEYGSFNIFYDDRFHDRFLILDNNIYYHLGSSINYLGKRISRVSIEEDEGIKDLIKIRINEILDQFS